MIEPRAQCWWAITRGISCHEDHLDLTRKAGWHRLKARSDICHVERTLPWATRIPEEQKGYIPEGLLPKLKRTTGCIDQCESGFRQGRCHQPAAVCRPRPSREE